MPVLNLDKSAHGDTLKVLLRLLEDEVGAGHSPALSYPWERNGTPRAEAHVVCCANGEVGEEEKVADVVGAQLEVTSWYAVFGGAA